MIYYLMTYVGHYKIDTREDFRATILVILNDLLEKSQLL